MKTTPIIIFLLSIIFTSRWSFQFEEIKNPESPSSKMYESVHQALGAGKYTTIWSQERLNDDRQLTGSRS